MPKITKPSGISLDQIKTSQSSTLNADGTQNRELLATKALNLAPTKTVSPPPVVLNPDQSSGGTNLQLPQPDTNTMDADATVAGAAQTSNALDGYLKKLEEPTTELGTQETALTTKLKELYGQNTGKAAATLKAEKDAGLDQSRKALADINNQILVKNAQYEKLQTSIEGKPIDMQFITGQQAQSRRMQASDIGLLQARALGMQGQIEAAQEAVTRAIDLQFKGIEEEITAKEKQLQLIQPLLNREQQKIANAQQLMLQDEKERVTEEKEAKKENLKLVLSAGITTKFVNKSGLFFNAADGTQYSTPQEFYKAAGVSSFEEAYAKGLVTDYTPSTSVDLKQYPASYQEYLLSKQDGYTGTYNDYQTMDANRKAVRSTTNNITNSPVEKVTDKFNGSVSSWNMEGTREQFIRQLQAAYPAINGQDIARKVYEVYPNGYDS